MSKWVDMYVDDEVAVGDGLARISFEREMRPIRNEFAARTVRSPSSTNMPITVGRGQE